MPIIDHLQRYAKRIRDLRRAHAAVQEPALAPAFQELLASTLADMLVGERLKDEAAREAGLSVDVWVDDSPQFVRSEPEKPKRGRRKRGG